MKTLRYWLVALAFGVMSCGVDNGEDVLEDVDSKEDIEGKGEAWNQANNPAYVDSTFVYDVATLPGKGETKVKPWSGDYWATASDSINHRWDGDNLSPAEKVAKAFNLPEFPKYITNAVGIYGHGTKACDQSTECAELKDGSSCVKPSSTCAEGLTCATVPATKGGRCIAGWWGICHGWAPAAISEPQAIKTATKNGVTFYPGDLEGLASFSYQSGLPTKFLSQRCNKKGDELGVDNNGRVREGECRDMNPGSMFVVLTNMLGLRGIGVVEDKTASYEVWNQPVRSYEVTNLADGKLKEITKAEAVVMLGGGLSYTSLLADTEIKKNEKKTGSYKATAAGEIIIRLSGTGDGDLHVKMGAEATESVYDCRPYEGSSAEECKITVAVGDTVYWMVLGYGDSSKVSVAVGLPQAGGTVYTYNTSAVRFFFVEMSVSYISESSPSRQPSNPDSYTRTDNYQFILEADASGKVVGGEWVGDSMTSHPDFMWWPSAKPSSNQGGFTYAMLKDLMTQASGGGGTVTPTTTTLLENVLVSGYTSKYATIGVPGGAKLEVKMTGTGNADLYVRIGSKPTIYTFTCKSINADSSESCAVTAPTAGGTYYVRVRPRTEATVTVTATVTPAQ